ncbi:Trypsin-like serine protease, DegP/HtrA family [Lactococcus cremoris subsp. cremoris UC509.9]|uniref:Trypsin-like peptidase domain-containing protein n=1 Tax=Lactococcus lactis subsp. cremoris TaxID=1359 RepID=A0AAJ6N3N8_LACLC|nr:trypsin-like peptidase domain-containing protein [Lactococcus cremoris]AFW92533.1 Trypsin-like serine protease, DegP/HtrA family [Lactococcus cremoris subsp. cremoris UC509.9]ARD92246.1 trypsin-like peptidase domain-containing protein [Lactococcus cremoris]MRM68874.1 PDZ domain-containing protein [Lactococcus cremoris]QJD18922.1 PDZ domain-containing protein [Lactococcus cremoris]QRZ30811.1 Trypsin-like serine protease- DegP/HtrA family [Lactococcus cremoris]
MAKANIGKLLLTGVVGGAIALGGSAIYQSTTNQLGNANRSNTTSTKVSNVSVNVNTDVTSAIKKVSNSVVSVMNYQKQNSQSDFSSIFGGNSGSSSANDGLQLSSGGSGVIYKKSGGDAYVVTNYHVIAGNSSLDVLLSGGQKVKATVVGYDEYTDLAVLKISSDHVKDVATFADSSKLTIGEPAIAVGSPLGSQFANTATEGILSATSRQVTLTQENGQTTSINAIQTDAAINPGNSGGALINIEGQVIGITQSKITTTEDGSTSVEGLGFAIPSNDVVNIINKLETDGKISRPALGIRMVDLSQLSTNDSSQLKLPSSVTGGVVVYSVQAGLPAATAGLKAGDVITKVGDTAVTSSTDLQSALYSHNINDTVKVTYYRDGKSATANVKLSKSTSDLETNSSSSSN